MICWRRFSVDYLNPSRTMEHHEWYLNRIESLPGEAILAIDSSGCPGKIHGGGRLRWGLSGRSAATHGVDSPPSLSFIVFWPAATRHIYICPKTHHHAHTRLSTLALARSYYTIYTSGRYFASSVSRVERSEF